MNTYRYVVWPFCDSEPAFFLSEDGGPALCVREWLNAPDALEIQQTCREAAALDAVARHFTGMFPRKCTIYLLDPDGEVTVWQMEPTVQWSTRRLS